MNCIKLSDVVVLPVFSKLNIIHLYMFLNCCSQIQFWVFWKVKCFPVACAWFFVLISPIYWYILVFKSCFVSHMYRWLQPTLLRCIMQIIFVCELQFIFLVILHWKFELFTSLPSFIYGQMIHFLHFFKPFKFHFGYNLGLGGIFALIKKSLMFCFCFCMQLKVALGRQI